jgi:hypothetical protein
MDASLEWFISNSKSVHNELDLSILNICLIRKFQGLGRTMIPSLVLCRRTEGFPFHQNVLLLKQPSAIKPDFQLFAGHHLGMGVTRFLHLY